MTGPAGDANVHVAGGGGSVYRRNGDEWRRRDTGDAALRAVERGTAAA